MSITEIEVIKNFVQQPQEQIIVGRFGTQKRSSLKDMIEQDKVSIKSEGLKSRSASIVSEKMVARNKLDAKQQNLYFQTIQIQWNSFLKLMRRQLLETITLKKPLIFDSEIIGKFLVQQDKLTFVNNNTLGVNCGKNTSNEVNITCEGAIQILNL